MDQPETAEPSLQPSPPAKTSLFARLLNVFAIPGDVFEEVKNSPVRHANWLVPALLFVLISWTGLAVIFSQDTIKQQLTEMTDKAVQQQIAAGMPAAQAEASRNVSALSIRIGMFFFPLFIGFITPLFWGLAFWLAGSKIMGGQFGYFKALEVAGLANTIIVLQSVLTTLLILVSGNLLATPSPAFFIKDFDPQNSMHAAIASANVMTIWLLVVRSIGLARLSAVSFSKAAMWVFGIWLSYTGFFIALGLAFKAAFKR